MYRRDNVHFNPEQLPELFNGFVNFSYNLKHELNNFFDLS